MAFFRIVFPALGGGNNTQPNWDIMHSVLMLLQSRTPHKKSVKPLQYGKNYVIILFRYCRTEDPSGHKKPLSAVYNNNYKPFWQPIQLTDYEQRGRFLKIRRIFHRISGVG